MLQELKGLTVIWNKNAIFEQNKADDLHETPPHYSRYYLLTYLPGQNLFIAGQQKRTARKIHKNLPCS